MQIQPGAGYADQNCYTPLLSSKLPFAAGRNNLFHGFRYTNAVEGIVRPAYRLAVKGKGRITGSQPVNGFHRIFKAGIDGVSSTKTARKTEFFFIKVYCNDGICPNQPCCSKA